VGGHPDGAANGEDISHLVQAMVGG